MTLVSGDMTSGEMIFGRLDRKADRYIRQETGIMKNYKINTVEPCLVWLFS